MLYRSVKQEYSTYRLYHCVLLNFTKLIELVDVLYLDAAEHRIDIGKHVTQVDEVTSNGPTRTVGICGASTAKG